MSRRLVITADDLGRDPVTDRVIAELLADGAVSATTVIAVAPDADRAVDTVTAMGVTPHLHVTLTSERDLSPWRPLSEGVSLRDCDGFGVDAAALAARGTAEDVVREADAQLAWLQGHGVTPRAADSHAGTLYGLHGTSWLADALQWCAAHELAFRLPRDPAPYAGGPLSSELAAAHAAAVELADVLGVALPAAIVTNRRGLAELGDYDTLRAELIGLLATLPEGTSELFLHPSAPGAVAGAAGTVREWEARVLRDPLWRDALAAEGIEIVAGWWS